MKKTMTNIEVRGSLECLNALTAEKIGFSPRRWYTLAANRKALLEANKLTEDTRLELVNKYGKKDKTGINVVPDAKMPVFTKAYNELMNMEIEVELGQITLEELETDTGGSLNGVDNLFLFFDYMVEAPKVELKKVAKGDDSEEKKEDEIV